MQKKNYQQEILDLIPVSYTHLASSTPTAARRRCAATACAPVGDGLGAAVGVDAERLFRSAVGVEPVSYTHLRGSGETWACGTGTCATVAALTELGLCPAGEDVHVQLRGGELIIRVLPDKKLLMTGSAVTVCEGTAEV